MKRSPSQQLLDPLRSAHLPSPATAAPPPAQRHPLITRVDTPGSGFDGNGVGGSGASDFTDDVSFFAWIAAHNSAAIAQQERDGDDDDDGDDGDDDDNSKNKNENNDIISPASGAPFYSNEPRTQEEHNAERSILIPHLPQQHLPHHHHHYHHHHHGGQYHHHHHHHHHHVHSYPEPHPAVSPSSPKESILRQQRHQSRHNVDDAMDAQSTTASASSATAIQVKAETQAEYHWTSFHQRRRITPVAEATLSSSMEMTGSPAQESAALVFTLPSVLADGVGGTAAAAAAKKTPTHHPPRRLPPSQGGNKASDRVRTCASCAATHSPEWRKCPAGEEDLCNACGLRRARDVIRMQRQQSGGATARGAKGGGGGASGSGHGSSGSGHQVGQRRR